MYIKKVEATYQSEEDAPKSVQIRELRVQKGRVNEWCLEIHETENLWDYWKYLCINLFLLIKAGSYSDADSPATK